MQSAKIKIQNEELKRESENWGNGERESSK
jgi:hypothetical protein